MQFLDPLLSGVVASLRQCWMQKCTTCHLLHPPRETLLPSCRTQHGSLHVWLCGNLNTLYGCAPAWWHVTQASQPDLLTCHGCSGELAAPGSRQVSASERLPASGSLPQAAPMQAQLSTLQAQYMHTALDLLASQGQGQAQLAVPAGCQAVPEGPHDTRSGTQSQLCCAGSTASAIWCARLLAQHASCLQLGLLH